MSGSFRFQIIPSPLVGRVTVIIIYLYDTKVFLFGLIIPDRNNLRVFKRFSGTFPTYDLKYTWEILKNTKYRKLDISVFSLKHNYVR